MDKELKEKWVKALRSGKLRQAKGALIKGTGKNTAYCCLGVLEKVCGTKRAVLAKYSEDLLPKDEDGGLVYRGVDIGTRRALALMNDGNSVEGERKSFKEIADYIEANL